MTFLKVVALSSQPTQARHQKSLILCPDNHLVSIQVTTRPKTNRILSLCLSCHASELFWLGKHDWQSGGRCPSMHKWRHVGTCQSEQNDVSPWDRCLSCLWRDVTSVWSIFSCETWRHNRLFDRCQSSWFWNEGRTLLLARKAIFRFSLGFLLVLPSQNVPDKRKNILSSFVHWIPDHRLNELHSGVKKVRKIFFFWSTLPPCFVCL